ncbi:MAG: signal peptide peptidase SppA, partial [Mycobacterium sp.]
GADALEHGLVDELGGFRAAVRRAKVLAGLHADSDVRIVSYPSSSLLDMVRRRASSQPAASLPDALAALLGRAVAGILDNAEQTLSGASVLWPGQWRL